MSYMRGKKKKVILLGAEGNVSSPFVVYLLCFQVITSLTVMQSRKIWIEPVLGRKHVLITGIYLVLARIYFCYLYQFSNLYS